MGFMRLFKKGIFSSSSLPAYYVATTGNDTTGNGTEALPWKTIAKAIGTVPDIACNIFVAAGTYAEANVANRLEISRVFTNWVTVIGVGSVTITDNASGVYTLRFVGGKRVRFQNVTIEQAGSNSQGTVVLSGGSISEFVNCTITTRNWGIFCSTTTDETVTLTGCTLRKRTGATGNLVGLYLVPTNGTVTATLTNCTISGEGTVAQTPVVYATKNGASAVVNMTVTGCNITGTGAYALRLLGGALNVQSSTFTAGSAPACVFGEDGVTSYNTTGSISDSTATSSSSHALLIGQGTQNIAVTNVTVNGGDYGIVLKHADGANVSRSTISGGTSAGVYFKAATNCVVDDCTINAPTCGVTLSNDPSGGAKCQNCTLTDTVITATGSGDCLQWGNSTHDLGGGVVDRNTYNISGTSGNVGDVRAATNIANLAALQAAWAGYDVPTNDANSVVI